ncbi:hypothetical protein [Bradyrhizobium niftali]|nr:hypothetical protein [Bradyrhizobium niftali]
MSTFSMVPSPNSKPFRVRLRELKKAHFAELVQNFGGKWPQIGEPQP